MILKAEDKHLDIVSEITQQTISEIYPHYYPMGAVEFFKAHHKDSNILADIKKGIVYLLKYNDDFVGTVTIKDNEICRLFVLPKFQHKGYGKELIDYAERVILKNHSEIILDASMSAKNIYKMRGYKETEYNQIITESGDILCYDVMKIVSFNGIAYSIQVIFGARMRRRAGSIGAVPVPGFSRLGSPAEKGGGTLGVPAYLR